VDWRDQWAVAMTSARPRLTNDAAEDLLRDIRTTWEDARKRRYCILEKLLHFGNFRPTDIEQLVHDATEAQYDSKLSHTMHGVHMDHLVRRGPRPREVHRECGQLM
jgi:hypothetical protein